MLPTDAARWTDRPYRFVRPPEDLLAVNLSGLEVHECLDLQGETGPRPIGLTAEKLDTLRSGQVLCMVTDHLPATHTVPADVSRRGTGEVLGIQEAAEGIYALYIRKI